MEHSCHVLSQSISYNLWRKVLTGLNFFKQKRNNFISQTYFIYENDMIQNEQTTIDRCTIMCSDVGRMYSFQMHTDHLTWSIWYFIAKEADKMYKSPFVPTLFVPTNETNGKFGFLSYHVRVDNRVTRQHETNAKLNVELLYNVDLLDDSHHLENVLSTYSIWLLFINVEGQQANKAITCLLFLLPFL